MIKLRPSYLILLIYLLVGSSHFITAQFHSYDLNHFEGIRSAGKVPDDFLISWDKKIEDKIKDSDDKELRRFWIFNESYEDDVLKNGYVTFNDPITIYLNAIKDILLADRPELRDSIKIYLSKDPSVNAGTLADGTIFFNVGLVAKAHSEAELAFVLCHEITHFTKKHGFETFKKKEDVAKGSTRELRKLNYFQILDLFTEQSQDHELEADAGGFELYSKSPYAISAMDSLMDRLNYSYQPFGKTAVGNDIFGCRNFTLPEVFFKDKLDSVYRNEDVFDDTRTHPNIHVRREALHELLKKNKLDRKKGVYFKLGKDRFLSLRELARFETVRMNVIAANYGDAIYEIYCLKKDYPASEFLDISMAKCLYGLASFKAHDYYSDVAKSFRKEQGQPQQVHYILKQFDRNQLAALALTEVMEMKKKYPEVKALDKYADRLTKYMVVYSKMSIDEFKTTQSSLPPFDKTEKDFDNYRSYFRAEQHYYRDFYKYILQPEVGSGWLQTQFTKYQHVADSLHHELEMRAKDREKRDRDKEKQIEDEGANLHVKDMVLLDPDFRFLSDDEDDYLESLACTSQFKKDVEQLSLQQNIKITPIYFESMDESSVADYNRFTALKEWRNEARGFYPYGLMPTSIDLLNQTGMDMSSHYLCSVMVYSGYASKKWYYSFVLYDLHNGEIAYMRSEDLGRRISISEFEKEYTSDLETISN